MAASEEKIYISPDAETIKNLDALRQDDETFSHTVKRLAEAQIEERLTHGDAVFHVKLVPDLREAVDKVRHDGELYSSAMIRIVEAFQNMEDVRVGKLTPDLWQKLDEFRGEDESYVDVIHRIVEAYQQTEDARVGMGTFGLWQKLDGIREKDERYADVIHRLIEEHNTYHDLYKVHITKSMQNTLNTIRGDGETYVDTIYRLIQEDSIRGDSQVVYLTKSMVNDLDVISDTGEIALSVIARLIKEHRAAFASYTVYLTKSMKNDLSVIRTDGETMLSVIERLIKEHLTIKQQQAMTPLGSTKVMRVKPTTCHRIESMACVGEDYNAIITRLIDERYLCRKIAKGMAEEGQRLLHNQSAIIGNFKLVIKELVEMDAVNVRDKDNIVQRDVDELLAEMLAILPDEEGDNKCPT